MIRVLLNAIRLALSALGRNKTRAALTMLGILIGVAAVVMVTALAAAATDMVGGQVDSFASNAIFVNPRPAQGGGRRNSGRLTESDARAIAREAVSIDHVAPFLQTQSQVLFADRNLETNVIGTTLPYFDIRKFTLESGTFWTENDELLKTKVCVIGHTVRQKLFGAEDPIGHVIRIGRFPYRVVGLLAQRGNTPFGEDQDDRVLMPLGSYRARIMYTWRGRVDMIMASATHEETTDRAIDQIPGPPPSPRVPEGADDDRIGSQNQLRASSAASRPSCRRSSWASPPSAWWSAASGS